MAIISMSQPVNLDKEMKIEEPVVRKANFGFMTPSGTGEKTSEKKDVNDQV